MRPIDDLRRIVFWAALLFAAALLLLAVLALLFFAFGDSTNLPIYLALAAMLMAPVVIVVIVLLHKDLSTKPGPAACASCGYLRKGLPEGAVCPECGAPYAPPALETSSPPAGADHG